MRKSIRYIWKALDSPIAASLLVATVFGASAIGEFLEDRSNTHPSAGTKSVNAIELARPLFTQEGMLGMTWEAWVAIGTLLLAAVTGALFVATYGLWRTTLQAFRDASASSKRQAREFQDSLAVSKTSAEAAMLSQRPWLSLSLRITDARRVKDTIEIDFEPTCENIGRTPATNIRIGIGVVPHAVNTDAWRLAPALAAAREALSKYDDAHVGYSLFPMEPEKSSIATYLEKLKIADIETMIRSSAHPTKYALTVCAVAQYDFVGGQGETQKVYILNKIGKQDSLDVYDLHPNVFEIEMTRIPWRETAK